MPHIRIEIHYTPNLAHYPGASSAAEAMQFDIDNADVHELIDYAGDDVRVSLIDD